ncbi:MAG: hypothetical protein J5I91_06540 [Bacteroidetes bacterium]|nr:hypothetical protein [Bacteroidota bacterium]
MFEFITNKASTKPSDNIQFRDEIKETDTFSKTVRSPAFEPTEEAVAPKSEEKTNIESEPIAETESKETILETDSLTEKDKIEEDSVPLNQEKIHLEENNEAGTIETTLGTEAQPVFNDNKIETHSFSEWLQQISKTPHLKVGDNQHKTTIEQTPTQFNHSIHKSKPEDFIAIIDSFLKNQPTISHPKSEFFKAENAAMRSLELDDDIVTETLASIYVKQGHKEEAIWAYEKLKLKFPEKESYFAALINELKKDTE